MYDNMTFYPWDYEECPKKQLTNIFTLYRHKQYDKQFALSELDICYDEIKDKSDEIKKLYNDIKLKIESWQPYKNTPDYIQGLIVNGYLEKDGRTTKTSLSKITLFVIDNYNIVLTKVQLKTLINPDTEKPYSDRNIELAIGSLYKTK